MKATTIHVLSGLMDVVEGCPPLRTPIYGDQLCVTGSRSGRLEPLMYYMAAIYLNGRHVMPHLPGS